MKKQKIIFLDRDNTINEDPGYLKDPEKVKILYGVKESLELLQAMGYKFIILSNQAGVAKGYMTEENVHSVNKKIEKLLNPVKIKEIYFCPHKDEDNCNCRKPKSGLLEKAINELNKEGELNLSESYIIGDRHRDLIPAESFDIDGILVPNEKSKSEDVDSAKAKNLVFEASSFTEAVSFILENLFERKYTQKIYSGINDKRFQNRLARWKLAKKTIVFTNGVFDILHTGHLQYLWQASRMGKIMIVGINSDESVKRLKGNDRPVNSIEDRMKHLSALSFIDAVVPFAEDTPVETIRYIEPEVHIKGGDYRKEDLPEYPIVNSYGGKIFILPFRKGYSTTSIIQKIKK